MTEGKGTVKKTVSKTVPKSKSKKKIRSVTRGRVYINSTFNNTIVTVTDEKGEVLSWSSGGVIGFSGTKKGTPLAASKASMDALEKAKKYGLKEVEVYVKGIGPGKETAVKALANTGVRVLLLKDANRFPHNGCRPRKRPR
jgi:small subunit ribosomal protein S11|uniref:Small ribosomal subunit protein uS11 n=1 Tax=candidate division CPR3 bacterium TaxID=2268181 RepID=A0A7C5YUB5_UNCC3